MSTTEINTGLKVRNPFKIKTICEPSIFYEKGVLLSDWYVTQENEIIIVYTNEYEFDFECPESDCIAILEAEDICQ